MPSDLLDRLRLGDERAAIELLDRYSARLISLARSRLPSRLAGRLDAEDVIQSVFRSFIRIARDPLRDGHEGNDLWRCLATITVHKVLQKTRHHTAGKRSVFREKREWGSLSPPSVDLASREPTPEEAASMTEELERAMRGLAPLHRRMVEMALQGHETTDIAVTVERTDRMVRLVLEKFRNELVQRLTVIGGG